MCLVLGVWMEGEGTLQQRLSGGVLVKFVVMLLIAVGQKVAAEGFIFHCYGR